MLQLTLQASKFKFLSCCGGPDDSLINMAAAAGLAVDGWSIMTFDWNNTGGNQGQLTGQAVDGATQPAQAGLRLQ